LLSYNALVLALCQVEEGTPFARWYTAGQAPLPDEGQAVDMYEMASRMLTAAGYEHYEVGDGDQQQLAGPWLRRRHVYHSARTSVLAFQRYLQIEVKKITLAALRSIVFVIGGMTTSLRHP
jgi:hypothetical protein